MQYDIYCCLCDRSILEKSFLLPKKSYETSQVYNKLSKYIGKKIDSTG